MYYIGCNVENTQIFLYIGGKVKNYTLTEGHKEHRVSGNEFLPRKGDAFITHRRIFTLMHST